MGTDTTTQGNWQGTYGADGYDIAVQPGDPQSNLPSYAALSFAGSYQLTGGSTSEAHGLVVPGADSTQRTSGSWYSSSNFTINVALSDDNPHELALYTADWYGEGGVSDEQIHLIDDATGAVLDTETLTLRRTACTWSGTSPAASRSR